MKREEKYLSRHHLDVYSETKFSKTLKKRRYHVFFPFEDKGVDIAAFKADDPKKPLETGKFDKLFLYQLKARNLGRYGNYWFNMRKEKIEEASGVPNFYWVFCALKPSRDFDFFVFPQEAVEEWMKQRAEGLEEKGSEFGDRMARNNPPPRQ